ncbi:hypothetical protein NADFUDRAFT_82051 [Nadsonia fulvescens var. elongata DSM 6958]|uniref:Uncharacterized protein n=1 Tax=Nadsonia fulvescens var. elongata DSM 6958 TaxID=857566 RepID=A0A1E3PQV1_9ASCO|nr:hypothetical protein NADFUDRAFT_82051 [Nadsonia fulvescens var. elongata DSM 6958]
MVMGDQIIKNHLVMDNQQAMTAFQSALDSVDVLDNSLAKVAKDPQASMSALTNFTLLKQNLWQINSLVNQSKTLNNELKSAVDVKYLDIHNILYQHLHFKEEIDQCNSYSSIYDTINLVPVDEFLEAKHKELETQVLESDSRMEDIDSSNQEKEQEKREEVEDKEDSVGLPSSLTAMEAYFEKINNDPHFLMLERLKDEDKRRRDISVQLTELEAKIKELTTKNKNFSEDLGLLDNVINEFVQNSSKIDEVLIKH